jgi:hypothetical protein
VAISEEKVDKVILHLPYVGFFSSFMQSRLAFLLFICAPTLILLILFGRDLWVAVAEFRKGGKGGKGGKGACAEKTRARADEKTPAGAWNVAAPGEKKRRG